MTKPIFISAVPQDSPFVAWLESALQAGQYRTTTTPIDRIASQKLDRATEKAIKSSLAVIVLISPDSINSERVMQECSLARQYHRPLLPALIRIVDALPWYVGNIPVEDFTIDLDSAFQHLLNRLEPPTSDMTFEDARTAYLERATLKSEHTISSYKRAIELLFDFLGDRSTTRKLPIQRKPYVTPGDLLLSDLSADDAPIFLHFAEWLLAPASDRPDDHRPYKAATVELRLAGVQNWFQFLDDYGWLPAQFPLSKAKRMVADELGARPQRSGAPQPPDHIEEVIFYYDQQPMPASLRKADAGSERVKRWELTRLRNRALLHTLAETGGRISEILSLNLDDFPERYLSQNEVLRVEVMGKGGHMYSLRFLDSLPAIKAYIKARGTDLRATLRGDVPLFVSHDARYDGSRMSRIVAWRIVQRAARALGLKQITPHDFRHWRATQLINAGHSLDVVQDYLGHRSVETTRAYYARTDPLRVDEAMKNTRLPDPGETP